MNDLIPFQFDNHQVRVVEVNGEVLFVARDVAAALGYDEPHKAVARHCDDAKSLKDIDGTIHPTQQNQTLNELDPQTKLIPESDVYALVFGSKLESAKRFKHWVTKEVLPQIRKTGSYSQQQVILLDELNDTALRAAADAYEAKLEAEAESRALSQQIEADKPYTEIAKAITGQLTMTRRDWCALMKQDNGLDVPEKKLTEWLINNKYIYRDVLDKTPRAYSTYNKLFKLEIEMINGYPRRLLKVTGRGILELTPKVLAHFFNESDD